MINSCPKCGSDNIGIWGLSYLDVRCNDCSHSSKWCQKGSRRDRYNEAIANWNSDGDAEVITIDTY